MARRISPFAHPRHAALTFSLGLATFLLVAVAADRSGAGAPTGSVAPAPSVPAQDASSVDPATAQWARLSGHRVLPRTTVPPPAVRPAVRRAPILQYRRRGAVRVFRDRPFGFTPRAVVLHGTGSGAPGSGFASLRDLHAFFAGPSATASSHYAVDREGRIAQFVDDDDAAFHVATPGWNDISIGIELLNDNSGRDPFPPAQLRATRSLVQHLASRYDIPLEAVVRHRTVQPADRRDPAANFPWRAWVASLRVTDAG